MKQQIRYFSIGLLTASLIILSIVSFFDKSETNTTDISVDEMIELIKVDGYHVLSASDYISLTVQAENENTDKETDTDNKEDEAGQKEDTEIEETEETEDAEIQTYTLTVVPNMLGPTISKLLEENKIIDNADEFNRYLETEGHAPYIQLGDHELSSDMSHFELAKKIAR